MKIFLKAGNERIFEVPFQYEQLKTFDYQLKQQSRLHFYKLIINTEMTDLPFKQIIFTLPYADVFEELLQAGNKMRQQMMINLTCPKLCINTFVKGEFLGSQFFDVMIGQYLVPAQASCNEADLVELQNEYKGLYVQIESNQLPDPVLYSETVEAFMAENSLNN